MRKRYSEQDLKFIEDQAKQGISCDFIGQILNVSASSIRHVLSRRGIKFCNKPLNHLPDENWVDCPNIEDVKISNFGRFVRNSNQSLISGYQTTGGYMTVDFSKQGVYSVHRLVAETFLENPENKPEVNHIDGVKTNNAVSNLEWVTSSENIRHSIEIGIRTFKSGQDHSRTALTTEQIVLIDKLHSNGETYKEISEKFGVNRQTVSRHVKKYRRDTERPETIPEGSRE